MSLQMCRWIDHSDAERVLEKVAATSGVRRGRDQIDASDQQTEHRVGDHRDRRLKDVREQGREGEALRHVTFGPVTVNLKTIIIKEQKWQEMVE